MKFIDVTYRSFAPLRMTGLQFVVILSGAKDLYGSLANSMNENTYESLFSSLSYR